MGMLLRAVKLCISASGLFFFVCATNVVWAASCSKVAENLECADEQLSSPLGQCGIVGASYDVNGAGYFRNENILQNTPGSYEATLGYILATQKTVSRIRWFNKAVSGAQSSAYLEQLNALEMAMNMENAGTPWTFRDGLNCLLVGPTSTAFANGGSTVISTDITNLLVALSSKLNGRSNPSGKVRVFLSDYPSVSSIQGGLTQLGLLAAYINNTSDTNFYNVISNLIQQYQLHPHIDLRVLSLWGFSTFSVREELKTYTGADGKMYAETHSVNPPPTIYKSRDYGKIHPNRVTSCKAAYRLTNGLFQSFGLATPSAASLSNQVCSANDLI